MRGRRSMGEGLRGRWAGSGTTGFAPCAVLSIAFISVLLVACGDSVIQAEDFAPVFSDPADGVWAAGPDVPWPVPTQSGIAFDTAAFVVGSVLIGRIPRGVVLRLDPTDRWDILPFVDFPGSRFDIVVAADTLFVLGRNEIEVALYAWSFASLSWSRRPSPVGGSSSAIVVVDDQLFLTGGVRETTTYIYSPESATWTESAQAPTPRTDPIVFAVDHRIFLFGLTRDGPAPLEVMDTRTGAWEFMGMTPLANTRLMTSRLGDRLHFFGGFDRGSTTRDIKHLAFDLVDNRWDTLPNIPTPRADGAGFVYGGAAFLVAGEAPAFDLGPEQPLLTVDKYSEPN